MSCHVKVEGYETDSERECTLYVISIYRADVWWFQAKRRYSRVLAFHAEFKQHALCHYPITEREFSGTFAFPPKTWFSPSRRVKHERREAFERYFPAVFALLQNRKNFGKSEVVDCSLSIASTKKCQGER